jgi:molybdenum cofactor cytidylyltransferase
MTGIVILAAGSSSRLGQPKQNLMYEGETLLQRAVNAAMASLCDVVIVVLGANEEAITPTIENKKVTIIKNPDWQEGMASSIRAGINRLKQNEQNFDSVILMLCDQPFVDAGLLDQLIQNKQAKGIVACAYNETIGPPVLFDRKYFDEMLLLKGQEGAKKLILKYPDDVETVPFPLGAVDIDTMEDYERLE